MVVVEKILNKILQHCIEKYHKWLLEGRQDLTNIAVYELIGCRQRAIFNRSLPHVVVAGSVKPNVIVGELVHEGIEKILGVEEKVYSKKIVVDGVEYTINAQPDYFDGEILIDFKFTTMRPESLPHEKHIMQIRLYKWVTGAKRAFIVYITPRGLLEYEEDGCYSDEDVKNLIKTWTSPRFPWECSSCEYSGYCPIVAKTLMARKKEQAQAAAQQATQVQTQQQQQESSQ